MVLALLFLATTNAVNSRSHPPNERVRSRINVDDGDPVAVVKPVGMSHRRQATPLSETRSFTHPFRAVAIYGTEPPFQCSICRKKKRYSWSQNTKHKAFMEVQKIKKRLTKVSMTKKKQKNNRHRLSTHDAVKKHRSGPIVYSGDRETLEDKRRK